MISDNPENIKELEESMEESVPVKVPPKKRSSLASAMGYVMSSLFFLLFFIGISQLYGQIIALITGAFLIFGWDPIITTLFMSLLFLFLGVTVYIISKRGSEAVGKVESGLRIMFKNPPTRFYDTSEIPTPALVREFVGSNNPKRKDKGRGCVMKAHDDGVGFYIQCDHMPMTKTMQAIADGKIDMIDLRTKIIITGIFLLFGALLAIVTAFGVLTGVTMWILWIIFLFSFFYVMIELHVLKLWSFILAWLGINVFFIFFVPDPIFLWTIWGAWICALIAGAIFYIISKPACKKKRAWYCPFLGDD